MQDRKSLFFEFHKSWNDINTIYENYARDMGMSLTMLEVLYELYSSEEVITQSIICNVTKAPKTTVNAIIINLQKQNYIELVDSTEDRRQKKIVLTKQGKAYVEPIMKHMNDAEMKAFNTLEDSVAEMMIEGIKQYKSKFEEFIKEGK